MRTQQRGSLCILVVILSLLFTQSITTSGLADLAEYQAYLPLAVRSSFVPSQGVPDETFDGDGMLVTDLSANGESAHAIALQPDGKMVVGGYFGGEPPDYQFLLVRINPDSSLDASFDEDGWVTTSISTGMDIINDILLLEDGKILAAGSSENPTTEFRDFALARYNPDGSLDTSFDGDGWLTTDFDGGDEIAYGVASQPDGKIVAAGWAWIASPYTGYDIALARYNPDGSLDAGFGGDGKVVTDGGIQMNDYGYDVALQKDGKIVVSGQLSNDQSFYEKFGLARYNPDGSLDNSFDQDGIVTTDFYNGNGYASDVVLQPDGKLVAAGMAPGPENYVFGLARYNPDGSLDTGFSEDGWLVTDFMGHRAYAEAVSLQPDGNILISGNIFSGSGYDFALARYTHNGSLDTAFSGDGWLTANFGTYYSFCRAMALLPDGRIVLVGEANWDIALVRYK